MGGHEETNASYPNIVQRHLPLDDCPPARLVTDQSLSAPLEDLPTPVPVSQGDARNSDKVLVLGATLARMGVGLLTFVLLARFLGPEFFGVIATAVAYTTFLALVSDYGLGLSALRDAAGSPARAGHILREALTLKALISLALTVLGAVIAVVALPTAWLPVYALVHVGALSYSFADLTLVAARATRRFDVEARVVIAGSVLMLVIVGGVAALTRDLTSAACAFAGSRLLYLLMSAVALRSWFAGTGDSSPLGARLWARMRASSSYAVDAILTNASSQMDVLLYGALLGAHAMGIYQAGARLVQVIMPLAVVLSTVYLPSLVAAVAQDDEARFLRNARRLNFEFAALSAIAGFGFAFIGPIVAPLIFGDSYAALGPLWAGFGVFATIRVITAAFGIQLAAIGLIYARIFSQVAAITSVIAMAVFFIPGYGVRFTSWVMAMSSVPSLIIISLSLYFAKRLDITAIATLMITAAVSALIVSL